MFLDIARLVGSERHRAGPPVDGVRTRLPAVRQVLRRLHEQGRRYAGCRVRALEGRRDARRPPKRPRSCFGSRIPTPTTTAGSSCSARTEASTSGSATAAPPTTRTGPARTSARCSASCCGSTPAAAATRSPRDNPFADRGGARPEILAYGLRNPWRFSFDRETGDLWIGDVGQNEQEEIDFLARDELASGANFGWSAFEGTARFNDDQEAPNAIEPVLTYGRDGGCSVTGGYVVRDPALESLYGRYLYADFCAGQLRSFSADDAALTGVASDDRPLGLQVPSVSSFAEDSRGHIYATSLDGAVYRLVPDEN